jgi:hypothetical protein
MSNIEYRIRLVNEERDIEVVELPDGSTATVVTKVSEFTHSQTDERWFDPTIEIQFTKLNPKIKSKIADVPFGTKQEAIDWIKQTRSDLLGEE